MKISLLCFAIFFIFTLTGCGNKPYETDEGFSVTFSIRVDNLVEGMHMLDKDKHELIPDDGFIFPARQTAAHEGESVFDLLQRVTRENRIHMAARFTPVIGDAYVEAIGNLYAYDAGPLSGWKYIVNGVIPHISASSYTVQAGDDIVWAYTLDLGRDLGMEDGAW
ncbi:MAG: DUF4430 domain-containing protein [Defluviitaleaceae bacterium]|nr:DUF4430 domain-containing protein [Defluviitaleaceae bacterium]